MCCCHGFSIPLRMPALFQLSAWISIKTETLQPGFPLDHSKLLEEGETSLKLLCCTHRPRESKAVLRHPATYNSSISGCFHQPTSYQRADKGRSTSTTRLLCVQPSTYSPSQDQQAKQHWHSASSIKRDIQNDHTAILVHSTIYLGVRSPTTAESVRNTRTRSSAGGCTRRAASEAEMGWRSCCTGTLERRRRWEGRGQTWVTEG